MFTVDVSRYNSQNRNINFWISQILKLPEKLEKQMRHRVFQMLPSDKKTNISKFKIKLKKCHVGRCYTQCPISITRQSRKSEIFDK